MTVAWAIRDNAAHDLGARVAFVLAAGLGFAAHAYAQPAAEAVAPVESGTAIADYWNASHAEYAATAEAILGAVGAVELRRGSIAASAAAELLAMFAGGGGAPQDVIKVREEYSASAGK